MTKLTKELARSLDVTLEPEGLETLLSVLG